MTYAAQIAWAEAERQRLGMDVAPVVHASLAGVTFYRPDDMGADEWRQWVELLRATGRAVGQGVVSCDAWGWMMIPGSREAAQ